MIAIHGLDDTKLNKKYGKIVNTLFRQYDLDITKIEFVGLFTNTVFKLTASDQSCYALRVALPGWRTKTDLDSEALWLRDISHAGSIRVPVPVFTKDNACLSFFESDENLQYYGLVMTWIEGTNLSEEINRENIYKMGELFGKLHEFSGTYNPPTEFTKRKMIQVFAREEKNQLFSSENKRLYSPKQLALYNEIDQKVQQAYTDLYNQGGDPIVINHDLHHENIFIVEEGTLIPFDFEDTCMGYPIQDIAMAMKDLMQDVDYALFPEYLDAFRSGYESIRDWPESYRNQMDVFMAGRMLWVGNWILANEKEYFTNYLKWSCKQMRAFLKNGVLRFR